MVFCAWRVFDRIPSGGGGYFLTLRGDAWFDSADRTYALRPRNILILETDQPSYEGLAVAFRSSSSRLIALSCLSAPAQQAGLHILPGQRY
jgi:hypothetical protein